MKLVIDRKIWLRGEGPHWSYLFRPSDGKMCCVGIYLEACGVTKANLRNQTSVSQVRDVVNVPREPTHWFPSADGEALYKTNDDESLSESDREKKIAALFAKHGVEVTFEN